MKGKPETVSMQTIPFKVFIRRQGVIVKAEKMTFFNKELNSINIKDIFPFCNDGDVLIIQPTRQEDWKAKRILKLIGGC